MKLLQKAFPWVLALGLLPALFLVGFSRQQAPAEAAISAWTTVHGTGTVKCPTGYRVSGGGFTRPADSGTIFNSGNRRIQYFVYKSVPYSSTGWTATGQKIDHGPSGNAWYAYAYNFPVYAVCIK